ncbi:MAG: hypothetical protein M3228_05370 [Actinomycetota bacterium]|nr:hypothetical protein [Actinomycetota bacterium]
MGRRGPGRLGPAFADLVAAGTVTLGGYVRQLVGGGFLTATLSGLLAAVVRLVNIRGGSCHEEFDYCGVVQPGIGAVGHPEKQVRPNMIHGTTVTSAFHGFRQRIDVPAGRSYSIHWQIAPGQVRRPIRIAMPDHLPVGHSLLITPPGPARVNGNGLLLDLFDQLPSGQSLRPWQQRGHTRGVESHHSG